MIKTKKGLVITAIAVVAVMVGIVSAINFSTPVHGQATHAQDGTCPRPGGCGSTVNPSMPKAPPPHPVFTYNPYGNTHGEFHTTGQQGSAQLGGALLPLRRE